MAKYQGKHVTKRSRRVPLSVWLAYLLVATLIATGVTFSGYVTEAQGSDSARVAKFEVSEITSGETTLLLLDLDTTQVVGPGMTMEHPIVVKNNSEVAIRYTLTATQTTFNLPKLTFTFVNVDDSSSGAELAPGAEGSYKLQISWPENANDIKYAGQVDLIQLTLRAEQVD